MPQKEVPNNANKVTLKVEEKRKTWKIGRKFEKKKS